MCGLRGAVAVVVGLSNQAMAQTPPYYPPVPPCASATSPFGASAVEARSDYVCPLNFSCSFQFSGSAGPSGVLEASIFVLKAGLQNRAFAASVTTSEGTTYYYTENPIEFSWSVQNMTLQCRSQL
jgi:hypothetical protein